MSSLSVTEISALQQQAHKLIPAGAHTYSRADDQFPANAPAFVQRAAACYFWDERGRKYLDYGMGLLSVTLGHAHEVVNDAVIAAIANGTCYSRPSILEAKLAGLLYEIIPGAEMFKFSKNGSDVTAAAIRLARHFTGRDLVVRCCQHPFHSVADWFIGSTSRPGGVPESIRKQVLYFDYNNLESLRSVFREHGAAIACVIMEPMTNELPDPGFLQAVKECCHAAGSLLIFDEIITGFRIHITGGQGLFGVIPDLSTFGKGIANGFPLAVLCGRRDIMQLGGMDGTVFLLSGTYGGETIGLTAALATINYQLEHQVPEYLTAYGTQLMNGFRDQINRSGLQEYILLMGHPARPELRFKEEGKISFRLKTLFMQEMLKHDILMERIGISYSHGPDELKHTLQAFENVCECISMAIRNDRLNEMIVGPIVKPVFTS